MLDLTGKVTVISGAANGLGAGHAELFTELGASTVIADVDDERGQALAEHLGDRAVFQHLDVTSSDDWDAVMKVAASLGGVDVLINNAGICTPNPLDAVSPDEFLAMVRVNQLGPFLGMQAASRVMEPGGVIVNIGSIDALRGTPNMGVYGATKGALRVLSKTAALEYASAGIRVLCIHPGAVDTPMMHDGGNRLMEILGVDPADVDLEGALKAAVPMGRVAQPKEIARWSAFLACGGDYATGAEFTVDGGLLAGTGGM